MSKQFWAVVAVVVVLLGGAFFVVNHKKAAAPSANASSSGLSNHVEGTGSTGVKLTEYGDYECPACGAYFPIIQQVYAKYSGQIFFQFRNFPLTSIHPNAFAGARAAEAAGLQNKYWQMHDALYENQSNWGSSSNPTPYFQQYAQQLGLNLTQFNSDFASSRVNDVIQADIAKGNTLGLTATPSFYLDSTKVVNPPTTLADWSKLIDATIANKAKQSTTKN